MKKMILPFILCLVAHFAMAQKIEMYKKFGGVRFTRGDTLLSDRQVAMLLFKDNVEAYNQFKGAKKYNLFSSILGFAGGAMIAIPVVEAITGGKPQWMLAGGGAALIIASIPLNRVYKARTLDALDTYNGVQQTSRIQPRLFFSGTKAGIIVKF